MTESPEGKPWDVSPLIFADIRFVRETLCGKSEHEGTIAGIEQLLDWVVSVLESDVAIAKAQGRTTVMDGRLTLSSAIDRAEHLTSIKGML